MSNNSRIEVKEEYGSFTLIKVSSIFSVGSKSLETIAAEAFVVYMNSVYFGLARKVNDPLAPSSILEILKISISLSPTTEPFI